MVLLTYAVLVGCDTFMLKDQFSAVGDSTDGDRTPAVDNPSETGQPLALLPAAVAVKIGEKQSFIATGGFPPYTFEANDLGTITQDGEFTAPGSAGAGFVWIEDSKGNRAGAYVSVQEDAVSPLELNPQSHEINQGDPVFMSVSGGTPPYNIEALSSPADLEYEDPAGNGTFDNFLYMASNSIGKIKIRVTDSLGAIQSVEIYVLPELPKDLSFIVEESDNSNKVIQWEQTKPGIDSFFIERRVKGVGVYQERVNNSANLVEDPADSGMFRFTDEASAAVSAYEYRVYSISGTVKSKASGPLIVFKG